jgi:hypothetical protein
MNKKGPRIREVIYISSAVCAFPSDDADAATEDDHFCSLLCDSGFVVHCVCDTAEFFCSSLRGPTSTLADALDEIVEKRCGSIPARSLAIVANELATPWLLSWLAEKALPMGEGRKDIGAITLIDPPRLSDMHSKEGYTSIFRSRYTWLGNKDTGGPKYSEQAILEREAYLVKRGSDVRELIRLEESEKCAGDGDEIENASVQAINLPKSSETSSATSTWEELDTFYDWKPPKHSAVESGEKWHLLLAVIGQRPCRAGEVGAALTDRILVLSTADESFWGRDIDVGEHWGPQAAEELSALYSCDPVIYLSPRRNDAEWHKQVSVKLTDWFNLLPKFLE